ncbi:MAG: hypothetical protein DI527_21635 [Chelatococcus sp.]|nr:MAG: hypothetical protein DI527_21635 [Chelatococcus sp.]
MPASVAAAVAVLAVAVAMVRRRSFSVPTRSPAKPPMAL